MNYPIVFDKFETDFTKLGLAVLDNAYNVKIREVINGEFILSFILPPTDQKWQYLHEEYFVLVDGQLFRMRTFEDSMDSSGKLASNVQCEHVWYDSNDCKHIPSFEMIGATPRQILEAAFVGTRFVLGTVDEELENTDIMMSKTNPAAIVNQLIENVGGEVERNNWTIGLRVRLGNNNGVQFRIGKNLSGIKRTIDSRGLTTRLYPYGVDDLDITSVNDSIAYLDSQYINNYDYIHVNKKEYRDIEDPAELKAKALEEFSTAEYDGIDKPKVTLQIDIVELNKLSGYILESFVIGDTVRTIMDDLSIDISARIMEYDRYPYEAQKSNVTLANFTQNAGKLLVNLSETRNRFLDLTTIGGKVKVAWLENIIAKLQTEIETGLLKKVAMHDYGDVWVDDIENPTKAMAIVNGMFAISNSRKENGDWIWRTFGNGDGFTADLITAGKILAQFIEVLPDANIQSAVQWNDALATLNDFVNVIYPSDVDYLQSQIDGNITSWFYDGVPSLANLPASNWVTDGEKDVHLGDLYYDNLSGYVYRFRHTTVYEWFRITDTDITKALSDAAAAQDTADSKRRAFSQTPVPPYDIGDLWAGGSVADLKRCKTAKVLGQSYSAADWELATKYTDDTTVNNLQVGGRNLFPRSLYSATYFYDGFTTGKSGYGFQLVNVYSPPTNGLMALKQNQQYTVSFLAWCTTGTTSLIVDLYPDTLPETTFPITTTPTKFTWTLSSAHADMLSCRLRTFHDGSVMVNITDIKLEEGNKATDWTPAPEDVQAAAEAVAAAQSALAQANAEAYADGIVTAEEQARINEAASILATANLAYTQATTNNINLIKNGGAEIYTGKAGTNIPDGWLTWVSDVNTLCTRRTGDGWVINGGASLEINSNASTTSYGGYHQYIYGLKVGSQYTASCKIGTHRCSGYLRFACLDINDVTLNLIDSTQVVDNQTPQNVKVTAIIPANTYRIYIQIIKTSTISGQPNSYLFVDNIKLEEGAVQTAYVETELGSSDVLNNSVQQDTLYSNVKVSPTVGIQVLDASSNERIRLGNYAVGKYGLMIKNAAGNATVLDQDGLIQSWGDSIVDDVDATHKLKLKFYIPPETLSIKKFILNFSREAYRATTKGGTAGGDHRHQMMTTSGTPLSSNAVTAMLSPSGTASVLTAKANRYQFVAGDSSGGSGVTLYCESPGGSMQVYTKGASGEHTHPEDYGIYEGTTATGVKVYIDGVLRLDNGGGGYTTDQANLDLSAWITTPGAHTLELSSSQLGRINAAYFIQVFLGV